MKIYLIKALMQLPVITFLTFCICHFAPAITITHIYVDQVKGMNDPDTSGTLEQPFRSITCAMEIMEKRGTPDPWRIHIRAGCYDSDPEKPQQQQEVFPIRLRQGMTLRGEDGATSCILSGAFDLQKDQPIIHGSNLENISIENLTLKEMHRQGLDEEGGAIQLVRCTGAIRDCIIESNSSTCGGGVWLSCAENGNFEISGNRFSFNEAQYKINLLGNDHEVACMAYHVDVVPTIKSVLDTTGARLPTIPLNGKSLSRQLESPACGGGLFLKGDLEGIICDNSFLENTTIYRILTGFPAYASCGGGGFYISGNLNGNLIRNHIHQNHVSARASGSANYSSSSASSGGGGFYIKGSVNGDIAENEIVGNECSGSASMIGTNSSASGNSSGGGFYIKKPITGNICDNIIKRNTCYAGGYGSGSHSCSGSAEASAAGFKIHALKGHMQRNTVQLNSCEAHASGVSLYGSGSSELTRRAAFYVEGDIEGNMEQNVISDHKADYYGGGVVEGSFKGDITRNIFRKNSGADCGGLYIGTFSGGEIAGNLFEKNRSSEVKYDPYMGASISCSGGGLYIKSNLNGNITDNIFSDNHASAEFPEGMSVYSAGGGFFVGENMHGNISGNTFLGNGVYTDGGFPWYETGSRGGGFFIKGFEGRISRNVFINNGASYSYRDILAYGGGFYVVSCENLEISENTFFSNSAYEGGGFFLQRAENVTIAKNKFLQNQAVFGGGLCAKQILSGIIEENAFSGNFSDTPISGRGGGLDIQESFTGHIRGNLFSANLAASGGGICLPHQMEKEPLELTIANNYFLNEATSDSLVLEGAGLSSGRNLALLNNTFIGGAPEESCLYLADDASSSILVNNIFCDLACAIEKQGKYTLETTHNDFFRTTDILKLDNIPLGNDLGVLENSFSEMHDNFQQNPLHLGEKVESGAWSSSPYYNQEGNYTILTDDTKIWKENYFSGSYLSLANDEGTSIQLPILTNTETRLVIHGNLVDLEQLGQSAKYSIDDFHLTSGSLIIDKGKAVSLQWDFEGDFRPTGKGVDIGADEYTERGVFYNAEYLAQDVPSLMESGLKYTVHIRMKNTGTAPWWNKGLSGVALGNMNDREGGWGINRVESGVGEVVPSGYEKTFTFDVTAPDEPGTYEFKWCMIRGEIDWFGEETPELEIKVIPYIFSRAIVEYLLSKEDFSPAEKEKADRNGDGCINVSDVVKMLNTSEE